MLIGLVRWLCLLVYVRALPRVHFFTPDLYTSHLGALFFIDRHGFALQLTSKDTSRGWLHFEMITGVNRRIHQWSGSRLGINSDDQFTFDTRYGFDLKYDLVIAQYDFVIPSVSKSNSLLNSHS